MEIALEKCDKNPLVGEIASSPEDHLHTVTYSRTWDYTPLYSYPWMSSRHQPLALMNADGLANLLLIFCHEWTLGSEAGLAGMAAARDLIIDQWRLPRPRDRLSVMWSGGNVKMKSASLRWVSDFLIGDGTFPVWSVEIHDLHGTQRRTW